MNKKKIMKGNDGITLVALVVTIVVLLILAGISLNLVLGENGIITRAQQAKKETAINSLTNEMEDLISKNESNEENNSNTFVMDGKQYQADKGMTFGEFLKTSSYTSNPLSTKKCNNCGKDISFMMGDDNWTYGYYSSDNKLVPHIRLYSNIDLYFKRDGTMSSAPSSANIGTGSILQNGIIITLTEMCSD